MAKKIFKFDILSFEYEPDEFLSDRIKSLSLDRDYEYNENNRMKKDKEVHHLFVFFHTFFFVWVYTFLYYSERKTIPIHIFEP